jgi:hypothetical protein
MASREAAKANSQGRKTLETGTMRRKAAKRRKW